jgi:hypothetical protein
LEGTIFDKPLLSSDFQSLARPALMRAWHAKWAGKIIHAASLIKKYVKYLKKSYPMDIFK